MIGWIIAISCWPIIGILARNPCVFYFYCAIQIILLAITYFLRKKGILTFCSPLLHYILAFIIGHVVIVGSFIWAMAHRGLVPEQSAGHLVYSRGGEKNLRCWN